MGKFCEESGRRYYQESEENTSGRRSIEKGNLKAVQTLSSPVRATDTVLVRLWNSVKNHVH